MDEERRAFYEFHAAMMEPWDGPAAVAFTDGRQIGATLDRNGLRPARYLVTEDDIVVMASEMGVLPIPEEKIVKKWRLQPGKMFLIDLEQGRIIDDEELKDAGHRRALSPVDRGDRASSSTEVPPAGERIARPALPARPPAGLRLLAGRRQVHPRADGPDRRRGDRLDGQRYRRCRCCRARTSRCTLLQAALRAGDQSADRSDPRRNRHVAVSFIGPQAEPARHRRHQPADPRSRYRSRC